MLRPTCLLLGAGALLSAVRADEIPADDAKIERVTVYADRAEVVRHFSRKLSAGDHTLLFDNLPAAADLASVRVDGRGAFSLVDIRAESVQTAEVENAAVRELTAQIKSTEEKLQLLTLADARITQRRAALDKVLSRLTTAGKESANPDMDPTKWAAYLQYHVDALAKFDAETLANKVAAENLRKEADRLKRELGALTNQRSRFRNLARVRIEVREADTVDVDLSYIVAGPGWRPLYDLRADTRAGKVAVSYQAEVRQFTGEDWKGVKLRLSTAQPGVGGREPQLSPWYVQKLEPVPVAVSAPAPMGAAHHRAMHAAAKDKGVAFAGAAKLELGDADAAKKVMEEQRAEVATGGTSATFAITRPYDVLSNNKPAKVGIAQETFDATFQHACVPKLSPHVYLKAKAVNKSEYPFLAGPTAVFLDGAFVANASLDLVPAGQEFTTHLGVDQNLSVERKEVAKREEVSGVFGKKTHRTAYEYVFKVKNSKSAAAELVLVDQLPVSMHEDIKVVLLEPKAEKDSKAFKLGEQQSAEWTLRLAPGEKRDVPFRFAVERPEDFQLAGQ